MTRDKKSLIVERDRSLDGLMLFVLGVKLNKERTALQDANRDWWPIAWSSHLNRYESSIAHVDAVLRRCSVTEDVTHIRVSTSAKAWINDRALAKGVAAWMIVDELIKRRGNSDGTK